jgi:hypothetical protein
MSSQSAISGPLDLDSKTERSEISIHQEEELLDSRFVRHLNEQFSPLQFPPELARRILTHGSHRRAAIDGHNARLSFVGMCSSIITKPSNRLNFRNFRPTITGRRVLHAYLTLFLHSSLASNPDHDYEFIASRTLNTYGLGQYVAPKWQLGRVLRWQPTINPRVNFNYDVKTRGRGPNGDVDPELAIALRTHPHVVRSVGLYKVMGEAVQAIVGGAYHQFVSWL